jgi:hypothetical protein
VNLSFYVELEKTITPETDLGELFSELLAEPLAARDVAVIKVLSELSRSQVAATLAALRRWSALRSPGQAQVSLRDLQARVEALGEADDDTSRDDGEALDRLLARVVALSAPPGAMDAIRATVRAAHERKAGNA